MRHFIAAVLVAATGCHDPAGVSRLGSAIPIVVAAGSGNAANAATATLDQHGFTIRGHIATPTPCYDLRAHREDRGRDITITVVATPREGGCVAIIGAFDYTIAASGACAAHLVVIHHYPATGWPDQRVVDAAWSCFATISEVAHSYATTPLREEAALNASCHRQAESVRQQAA